jgi:hypothetical protein
MRRRESPQSRASRIPVLNREQLCQQAVRHTSCLRTEPQPKEAVGIALLADTRRSSDRTPFSRWLRPRAATALALPLRCTAAPKPRQGRQILAHCVSNGEPIPTRPARNGRKQTPNLRSALHPPARLSRPRASSGVYGATCREAIRARARERKAARRQCRRSFRTHTLARPAKLRVAGDFCSQNRRARSVCAPRRIRQARPEHGPLTRLPGEPHSSGAPGFRPLPKRSETARVSGCRAARIHARATRNRGPSAAGV